MKEQFKIHPIMLKLQIQKKSFCQLAHFQCSHVPKTRIILKNQNKKSEQNQNKHEQIFKKSE
uniref:Uncharacterized protein n=1 Tax=Meloidogyne enterolobii TaxID=390850 RepID=A0A6V7X568_MELEN|nr:unnamed protein product [Meloidogyne enterolobii]